MQKWSPSTRIDLDILLKFDFPDMCLSTEAIQHLEKTYFHYQYSAALWKWTTQRAYLEYSNLKTKNNHIQKK